LQVFGEGRDNHIYAAPKIIVTVVAGEVKTVDL
jgi:hypothetical protein